MNVLFIYSLYEIEEPIKPLRSQEQIQFGVSYISSVLKTQGHQTELVVLSRTSGVQKNKVILDKYIEQFKPKLICFTSVSSEYEFIAKIAKYLRSRVNGAYFLIGGVHVTLNPKGVLDSNFDALCIGEGEHPVLELVDLLEKKKLPTGIQNLWIKQGDKVEKNPTRPFLKNLDSLPFPDREMWQDWIDERSDSQHSILLGRGCPFGCTYCCNHALKKKASGDYVRLRSPNNIIEEIKEFTEKYPKNKNVYLEIETFTIDRDWSLRLCSELEKLNNTLDKPLSFGINLRISPNAKYDDLFAACKKSNFRFINIGPESGSERVRREVLNRIYANSDVINAVKSARRHNLRVAFYNLIGLPGESMNDFKKTIELNRVCQPDWIMYTIFFPYPGTDLYALCDSKGYLDNSLNTEMERSRAVLNTPDFPKKKIQKAYEWFYYDVYKDYKPLHVLLIRVFVAKLRKWPRLFGIYTSFIRWGVYKNIKHCLKKMGIWKNYNIAFDIKEVF